jgi:iron-sulfur cluster repair protein YtfE (RIC family)
VSSADKTDHQEAGDAFAEMAQVAASRQTEAERRAAVTYAMLAIYHELRRNDLGAKIDALTEQVGKIAALQGQRPDIESGLAETSGS